MGYRVYITPVASVLCVTNTSRPTHVFLCFWGLGFRVAELRIVFIVIMNEVLSAAGRGVVGAGRYLYNDYRRRSAYAAGTRRARMAVALTGRPGGGLNAVAVPRMQMQIARISRSIGKPEVKYLDTAISLLNVVDTTGAIQHLTAASQGVGVTNRVGNKMRVKHIYCQVRVSEAEASIGTAPTTSNYIRWAVVRDRQQVGDGTPASTDVFTDVTTPQHSIMNINSQGRFEILYLSPLISAARIANAVTPVATLLNQAPTQSNSYEFQRSCNFEVTFNGAASTDIQKNGLYVCVITNINDTVDVDGYCRLRFTDV